MRFYLFIVFDAQARSGWLFEPVGAGSTMITTIQYVCYHVKYSYLPRVATTLRVSLPLSGRRVTRVVTGELYFC